MKVEKHEYLLKDDHYEVNGVMKGRSDKTCEFCAGTIKIGTPHDMHNFYPDYQAYAVHKECHDNFIESLNTNEDIIRKEYEGSMEYQLEQTRKIINN